MKNKIKSTLFPTTKQKLEKDLKNASSSEIKGLIETYLADRRAKHKPLDLEGLDLKYANLGGTEYDPMMDAADLRGVNLRGANLFGANLRGVNLSGADLSGADLSDANLFCADISGTNLYGARNVYLLGQYTVGRAKYTPTLSRKQQLINDLKDNAHPDKKGQLVKKYVNECRREFVRIDLSDVNLRRANLRDVDLRGADLRGADLHKVDLSYINLDDTDLRGVKNANLENTFGDPKYRPDGSQPMLEWQIANFNRSNILPQIDEVIPAQAQHQQPLPDEYIASSSSNIASTPSLTNQERIETRIEKLKNEFGFDFDDYVAENENLEHFLCPLSGAMAMRDPVIVAGNTCDRSNFEEYTNGKTKVRDPFSGSDNIKCVGRPGNFPTQPNLAIANQMVRYLDRLIEEKTKEKSEAEEKSKGKGKAPEEAPSTSQAAPVSKPATPIEQILESGRRSPKDHATRDVRAKSF